MQLEIKRTNIGFCPQEVLNKLLLTRNKNFTASDKEFNEKIDQLEKKIVSVNELNNKEIVKSINKSTEKLPKSPEKISKANENISELNKKRKKKKK